MCIIQVPGCKQPQGRASSAWLLVNPSRLGNLLVWAYKCSCIVYDFGSLPCESFPVPALARYEVSILLRPSRGHPKSASAAHLRSCIFDFETQSLQSGLPLSLSTGLHPLQLCSNPRHRLRASQRRSPSTTKCPPNAPHTTSSTCLPRGTLLPIPTQNCPVYP